MSYDNFDPEFYEFVKKSVKRNYYANIDLKELRESLGIGQKEVLGISQPDVSKIENRKDIKLSTLIKYAEGLGMKVKISFVSDDKDKEIAITQ